MAVGTDLMYSVPTKLLAAFVHARQRTVDPRVTAALAAGGIPGAMTGLGIFAALRAHVAAGLLQQIVRHAIGVAILSACVAMIAMYVLRARIATPRAVSERGARTRAIAIGFVVGALVAVTSIGSGSVTLPLLLLALPAVAVRRLIGSEIAFAAIVVPVAALGHTTFGDIDWRITGSLLAGSLPGVYLGSRLCVKIDERPLRAAVMVILGYAAYRLL
jgi:uncharacterized membrane protein YfcA